MTSTVDTRAFPVPLTIGVLADTHVYRGSRRQIPPEALSYFRRAGVGLILHAGDINTSLALDQLAELTPVLAVVGNNDDAALQASLPAQVEFRVGLHTFMLVHGHQARTARAAARRFAGRVDCVVYGHSHIPMIEAENGTILFNPGSPTDRRWRPHFGIGLIRVTADKIEPELVLFSDPSHLATMDVATSPYTAG